MPMATFTVEVPDEAERGVRIRCDAHSEERELRPGRRRGTMYCEKCGFEVEIDLYDQLDWRDWGEHC